MDDSLINPQPKLSKLLDLGMNIRSEPQSDLENLLSAHDEIFKDRVVLDLTCYTGVSSNYISKCQADFVIGVDFDSNALSVAKENFSDSRLRFLQQNIEETQLLLPLVSLAQVVVTFGALYHLKDCHGFIKTIAQPNIEYCVIDTLYGPETYNTNLFCRFERCSASPHDIIPKFVPNISWLIKQFDVLGFGLDRIEKYYTTVDFSTVTDHEANKRMTTRFFNRSKFNDKKSLSVDEVWEWSNDNLIMESK
jgi:SAM-dependent methyltransferase